MTKVYVSTLCSVFFHGDMISTVPAGLHEEAWLLSSEVADIQPRWQGKLKGLGPHPNEWPVKILAL